VVRIKGDDRVSWLNGQITNDVREIASGTSVHALAVNVRGKILAELWVTAREDELWLLCPTRAQTALLESFERYIIMEDVELTPWPEARVISLEGPRSHALQAELAAASDVQGFAFAPLGPPGFPGYAWVGSDAQLAPIRELLSRLAPTADDSAFELARLRLGLPRYGVDYDEHQYPQEAGLKASVSFQKGCYLGQEVVCTLESRGRLSRQLCALSAAAPEAEGGTLQPGETISLPAGDVVGAITSAAWDPELGRTRALGYVKRAHAAAGTSVQAGRQLFTIEKLVGAAA
jgi:folate-binding protein YgfZ